MVGAEGQRVTVFTFKLSSDLLEAEPSGDGASRVLEGPHISVSCWWVMTSRGGSPVALAEEECSDLADASAGQEAHFPPRGWVRGEPSHQAVCV